MTLLDILCGDDASLRETERALRAQEDKVFKFVDNEDHDLATHVRADIPRFETLNLRQRLGQARQERAARRQLLLLLFGFMITFGKLFGSFDLLLRVFQAA